MSQESTATAHLRHSRRLTLCHKCPLGGDKASAILYPRQGHGDGAQVCVGAEAILPSGDERTMAVLTSDSRLALADTKRRASGSTLQLVAGALTTTTAPAWAKYARSLAVEEKARILTIPLGGPGRDVGRQEALVALSVSSRGDTSVALVRAPRILAARVSYQWEPKCNAVEWITPQRASDGNRDCLRAGVRRESERRSRIPNRRVTSTCSSARCCLLWP